MSLVDERRPAAGDPAGLLVLLHGRGADERDLLPLADYLDPQKGLLVVSPRGPLALPPGGAHWYAVREIGFPDPATFLATFGVAAAWLDGLWEETGLRADSTVLAGFSQGAVMAYSLGLASGRPRPAALVAMSGFVPTVPGFELDLSAPLPPVAISHGTYDPVISVDWGCRARDLLQDAGADVLYRESPVPHTIDPRFLSEARPWLDRALGPLAS